ncbi:SGNH/GDSL hydrolase family protein [Tuwongella immobilis]|uniref:SGNH hydrolase-type esterase domain-containing protein n=1 Tax=Tuwongella immobilis TaxID=692036 RepID=A0A6C2YTS8_9BACT|nr:SGNH/GDSL hydrolase family protein [Tuwongella immobilis]VIP04325.1 Lipolytic protein G-D-S-L family OS=Gloeocapsa sp. PCC 7428 GN=Glo7428_1898 PE=4 SV=1: Lipase_GDSL_2 [Tuwongella immobilis]VTS06012.1 Lipolytic protein G-D-S-L family OS=Gloeocapsa sp. PCC 7428 GN=Glo7428_1898 PE=4 SV=1: Lipase_GDSL_2 [Tuwongella immobilis]
MRSVLCFGASNTWGYEPGTGRRFSRSVRWPGRLQQALGDSAIVYEEGLNGRTTNRGDANRVPTNGYAYLKPCLLSHAPVDLVIVMLGTNDLAQPRLTAQDIADGMQEIVELLASTAVGQNWQPPAMLVMSPPPLLEHLAELYGPAVARSRELAPLYRYIAGQFGAEFLDAGEFAQPSAIDGVHLDAEGHRALAEAVIPVVQRILARLDAADAAIGSAEKPE